MSGPPCRAQPTERSLEPLAKRGRRHTRGRAARERGPDGLGVAGPEPAHRLRERGLEIALDQRLFRAFFRRGQMLERRVGLLAPPQRPPPHGTALPDRQREDPRQRGLLRVEGGGAREYFEQRLL